MRKTYVFGWIFIVLFCGVGLTSCKPVEIIGDILIEVVFGDDDCDAYEDCYDECHEYRDYHGNWHEECEYDDDEPGRGRDWLAINQSLPKEHLKTISIAQNLKMSHTSAQKLYEALIKAKKEDYGKLKKLGLDKESFEKMEEGMLPNEKTLDRVSKNLNQYPKNTKRIFDEVLDQLKKHQMAR